jgi:hypothetical protein
LVEDVIMASMSSKGAESVQRGCSAVGRDPRAAMETGGASRRWQRHPLDRSRVRTVGFVAAPVNFVS